MKFDTCTRSLILMFFTSVTFFSCERVEKPQTARSAKGQVSVGGTLVSSIPKTTLEVCPQEMTTSEMAKIGVHLFEGLVRLDPSTSEVIPAISETWSAETETSSFLFNLRSDVKFHHHELFGNKGRSLTAADVVYSFEQLAKRASDDQFAATVGRIKGAEAFRNGDETSIVGISIIDDYKVKITLNSLDRSFLYVLAQPSMGIIPKALGNEVSGVSAGPFILSSSKNEIILVRNTEYHLEDEFGNSFPYLDTLVLRELASNTEQLKAFFAGDIHILTNLELDPVRSILEMHVSEFSGKNPKYIMKRETDNASYETYSIYRSGLENLGTGFMGYHDFSRTQIEQ